MLWGHRRRRSKCFVEDLAGKAVLGLGLVLGMQLA